MVMLSKEVCEYKPRPDDSQDQNKWHEIKKHVKVSLNLEGFHIDTLWELFWKFWEIFAWSKSELGFVLWENML
jgi:hypothetical protein